MRRKGNCRDNAAVECAHQRHQCSERLSLKLESLFAKPPKPLTQSTCAASPVAESVCPSSGLILYDSALKSKDGRLNNVVIIWANNETLRGKLDDASLWRFKRLQNSFKLRLHR
jgi:hypothetical protein